MLADRGLEVGAADLLLELPEEVDVRRARPAPRRSARRRAPSWRGPCRRSCRGPKYVSPSFDEAEGLGLPVVALGRLDVEVVVDRDGRQSGAARELAVDDRVALRLEQPRLRRPRTSEATRRTRRPARTSPLRSGSTETVGISTISDEDPLELGAACRPRMPSVPFSRTLVAHGRFSFRFVFAASPGILLDCIPGEARSKSRGFWSRSSSWRCRGRRWCGGEEWERGEPIELAAVAFAASAAFWATAFWGLKFAPVGSPLRRWRFWRFARPRSSCGGGAPGGGSARRARREPLAAGLGAALRPGAVCLCAFFSPRRHVGFSGGDMTAHAASRR